MSNQTEEKHQQTKAELERRQQEARERLILEGKYDADHLCPSRWIVPVISHNDLSLHGD